MSKKAIVRIVAFAILAAVTIITVPACRRQRSDNIMELILWPTGTGRRGDPGYYFVVNNRGILTSYSGRSRLRNANIGPGNPLRPIRRTRTRITLSEEDFQHISELVDAIVAGETGRGGSFVQMRAVFSHSGNIYYDSTMWTGPIKDLIPLLVELSPFTVRIF